MSWGFVERTKIPKLRNSVKGIRTRANHRLKPATGRPYVPAYSLSGIVPAFTCDLRRILMSTCVCLRLREQCLRTKITPVARVAYVLLLRFVAGNMDVNTQASKRSQLIGNTAIVRKHRVIHKKSTCVCLRLSVAARFDLWPALEGPVL